ncbi:MAG: CYTH domain-containing protein [Rhabdochlamydiaceae bacterium]
MTPEQEKALIEGAEFLGEKKFTDTYYDDLNYSLTTKDIWFRNRDRKFELKLPMNVSIEERVSDQYKEIEDEREIKQYFKFDNNGSLPELLENRKYVAFCIITTTRRKYKKEGFGIDLDIIDFGYTVAEIEYMADDGENLKEATDKIIAFANNHGIVTGDIVRGKGAEYLRRNKPEHFQALIDAKVLK